MASSPSAVASRWLPWLGALLLAAAGGYVGWQWWNQPDMARVLAANNRGVGHIEEFDFPQAAEDFDEVVRLAPDWLPGRVNQAIAVLNLAKNPQANSAETEAGFRRARALFEGILRADPQN